MTIIFQGHVERIGLGHMNRVELTLRGSVSHLQTNPLILEVSKPEAEVYRVGMAVEFKIIPRPDVPIKGEK